MTFKTLRLLERIQGKGLKAVSGQKAATRSKAKQKTAIFTVRILKLSVFLETNGIAHAIALPGVQRIRLHCNHTQTSLQEFPENKYQARKDWVIAQ